LEMKRKKPAPARTHATQREKNSSGGPARGRMPSDASLTVAERGGNVDANP
jgi:hypothetical protein